MVRYALTLTFMLMLTACARKEDAPESGGTGPLTADVEIGRDVAATAAEPLVPGRTFGQTFVCKKNGLAKVEVMIATYTKTIPQGVLMLRLRSGPDEIEDLAKVSVPASSVADNAYVALEFSPLRNSAGKTYYLLIETRGIPPGYAFTVWRSQNDAYPQGSFYIDGRPQPQDICFRTWVR